MRQINLIVVLLGLMAASGMTLAWAQTPEPALTPTVVVIPHEPGGIGFDDMGFSPSLHKVILPGERTGKLFLIDPATQAISAIPDFSSQSEIQKEHSGVTSADEAWGFIFTADHGTHVLDVVDVKSQKIIATSPLAGEPDYVRALDVAPEIWVTEPHQEQIEVFTFSLKESAPTLVHQAVIPVPGGPESLVVDHLRRRAYTNLWTGSTIELDLDTHTIVAQWANGCDKSRGLALDERRGFLFIGCGEGKAVALDIKDNGKQVGSRATGPGVDVISYNPVLSHLYAPGAKDATLSVLGVSGKGELFLLGVGQAVKRSHCVVADDQNNMWVCDPENGQILLYRDTFPGTK